MLDVRTKYALSKMDYYTLVERVMRSRSTLMKGGGEEIKFAEKELDKDIVKIVNDEVNKKISNVIDAFIKRIDDVLDISHVGMLIMAIERLRKSGKITTNTIIEYLKKVNKADVCFTGNPGDLPIEQIIKDPNDILGFCKDSLVNSLGSAFKQIVDHPEWTYEDVLNEKFVQLKCDVIEILSINKIAITLDTTYSQFMIFTKSGFLRLQTYHKELSPSLKLILNTMIKEDPSSSKEEDKGKKERTIFPSEDIKNGKKVDLFLSLVNDTNEDLIGGLEYKFPGENYEQTCDRILEMDRGKPDGYKMENVLRTMWMHYKTRGTRFISLLGKARFWVDNKKHFITSAEGYKTSIEMYSQDKSQNFYAIKTAMITDEIISQLIFRESDLGFITGGYKGKTYVGYGVTRSGYEIPKRYQKPTCIIMCNAGLADRNEHADGFGLYGMHWGDDTPALSALSDGAIFIAPFGAWTHIELALCIRRKIRCAIYLDPEYIDCLDDLVKRSRAQSYDEKKLVVKTIGAADLLPLIDTIKAFKSSDRRFVPYGGKYDLDECPLVFDNPANLANYMLGITDHTGKAMHNDMQKTIYDEIIMKGKVLDKYFSEKRSPREAENNCIEVTLDRKLEDRFDIKRGVYEEKPYEYQGKEDLSFCFPVKS